MNAPEEKEMFPYWEYRTVGDANTRKSHKALYGVCLPADDDFWKDHFPPWDWGCRCKVIQVSKFEADRRKKAKDPTFIDGGKKLEDLRAGTIKTPQGGTVDVLSPESKAEISGSSKDLVYYYRNNPADLHLDLGQIRDKYTTNTEDPNFRIKEKLFDVFSDKMHNKPMIKPSGVKISVWDWLCESEIKSDSNNLMEFTARTGKEKLIIRRDKDNSILYTNEGEESTVAFIEPGEEYSSIHSHPGGNALPSVEDLKLFAKSKGRCKSLSVCTSEDGGVKTTVLRMKEGSDAVKHIREFYLKWNKLLDEDGFLPNHMIKNYKSDFLELCRECMIREDL